MSSWFSIPDHIPVDGAVVYICIVNYWQAPFKAKWSLSNQNFTSIDYNLEYPVWSIIKWCNV